MRRVRGCVLALIVPLLLFSTALAAPQPEDGHNGKTFLIHLLEQERDIWTAPVKPETWKSTKPLLLAGLSALSFTLDGEPSRRLRQESGLTDFNNIFASSAASWVIAAYPVSMLAAGGVTQNERVVEYGWKATEAMVDAFTVSLLLKSVTRRARPHTGKVYGFGEGGNSFPSGHSMAVWAMASVTTKHFSESRWVPWVAYPLAGVVAFSRVSSGHHFVSDAVAGSIIGYSIGRYVVK